MQKRQMVMSCLGCTKKTQKHSGVISGRMLHENDDARSQCLDEYLWSPLSQSQSVKMIEFQLL